MSKLSNNPLVLMYHGVVTEWTPLPEEREAGADLYDVLLPDFQAQIKCLHSRGYHVSTLDDDLKRPHSKKIVLTFDDGEMNNYEQAFPVLKKWQFPAYFFIIAKRIGNKGYMGWDELKEMHNMGMVIGSHGFSHEILTNLEDTQIEEELWASKRYLEKNLNISVESLSIPRGFCDDKVIGMAYDAGYKHVFISDRPKKLQAECYSRIAVKAGWTVNRFKQTLDGEVPVNEQVTGLGKRIVKRIFGEGVYDWVRGVLLKIK
jgi:peptidoglycan/xylan/chitin deacetylase (PgdA/CDA1 family)